MSLPEFFRVAGPARIVAGHLNAAVQRAAVLETGDVVALPAVQAEPRSDPAA